MRIVKINSNEMRTLRYLLHPSISDITTSKLWDLQWKLINFHKGFDFLVENNLRALLKHTYSISTESSYQIPPNQGFPSHHFELREFQVSMQHFSYRFHSFLFQLTNID